MDAKTWAIILSGLIGGLGLFLYGMSLMSSGLQKIAGENLKRILEKLTSNRFFGAGVGAIVTMLVQSSTATTVMVVGFVNAGLMSLTQALSVILGANVGTTITAQILAFKVTAIALPAIGVGAALLLFIRKSNLNYIGEIVMGIGLLFFGMSIMTDAFIPLQESEGFRTIFVTFSSYPVLAVFVGTAITIIIQSSSATIGITLALATNGLVDFQIATALILGDNIGTTITANIAAIGGSRTAKQAAFGHFLLNIIGATYILILLRPFVALVDWVTPGDPSLMLPDGTFPYIARHIANAHTIFNVINVALFLPLLSVLAYLCQKIIKTDAKQKYRYTHLADGLLGTPETAVAQVRREVARMSSITMTMLKTTETALQTQDKEKMGKISEYEKTLDGFRNELLSFLDLLQGKALSGKALFTVEGLRLATSNLEEIGDQAKKLMKIAAKMLEKNQQLSPIAKKELNEMFDAVIYFASKTFNAFSSGYTQTEQELATEDEIDRMHKQFRKNHIKRLNKGQCMLDTGMNFVDILGALEKIGDHIFAVAQINLYKKEEHKIHMPVLLKKNALKTDKPEKVEKTEKAGKTGKPDKKI